MAKQAVSITFREGVQVEQIHDAVERFIAAFGPFGPGGCRTCGLAGVDILLTAAGDPEPFAAVQSEELRQSAQVLQVALNPQPLPPR
jgi:hypothetical protein